MGFVSYLAVLSVGFGYFGASPMTLDTYVNQDPSSSQSRYLGFDFVV